MKQPPYSLRSFPPEGRSGWPFFLRGARSILDRSPNMWTLIGLGTSAAYLYSVAATLAPGLFPESFRVEGQVAVYFEAAAVIISLALLGQILELKARSDTWQGKLRRLLDPATGSKHSPSISRLASPAPSSYCHQPYCAHNPPLKRGEPPLQPLHP